MEVEGAASGSGQPGGPTFLDLAVELPDERPHWVSGWRHAAELRALSFGQRDLARGPSLVRGAPV